MKFNLKSYNDLGKYCWPMSVETFDTDRDKIFILCKNFEKQFSRCEVPIDSLQDLIPFLWSQPFIEANLNRSHALIFKKCNPDVWWKQYSFDTSWYERKKDKIINKIIEDNK